MFVNIRISGQTENNIENRATTTRIRCLEQVPRVLQYQRDFYHSPQIGDIRESTDPQGLGVGSHCKHGPRGMEGDRSDGLSILQTTDWDKLGPGH